MNKQNHSVTTLASEGGVRLHCIYKDTFKTDHLSVCFLMPYDRTLAPVSALLPAVMMRGCEPYPTYEALSERLDTLYNAGVGGYTRRHGAYQCMTFYVRTLERGCIPDGEDVFSESISVLSALWQKPLLENGGFLPAYVEGERRNIIDGIRGRLNNRAAYAQVRCEQEMDRGAPYSMSDEEMIDALSSVTPRQLYRAWEDMLASTSPEIFYVGKQTPEQVAAALKPLLGPLAEKRGDTSTALARIPVKRTTEGDIRYMDEEAPIKQGRLCIGCRSGMALSDGSFYIFTLLNELLGGSGTSKLFMEVRERLGLCYDCYSVVEGERGTLLISCGIAPDTKDAALTAILAQLEALKTGDFTDEALEEAKYSLCAGYRELEDGARDLIAWYLNRYIARIDTSPDEAAEQVMSVTREEIIRAARGISVDTVYFLHPPADYVPEDEENEAEEGFYGDEA